MTASAPQPGDTHLTHGTPPAPGDRGAGAEPADAYDEPTGDIAERAVAARAAGARDTDHHLVGTDTGSPAGPADPAAAEAANSAANPAAKPAADPAANEAANEAADPAADPATKDRAEPGAEPGAEVRREQPAVVVPADSPADRSMVPVPTPRAESFWLHAIERGEHVPEGELIGPSAAVPVVTPARPARRPRPKGPRRPGLGLPALLVLALLGTFFAWVSAEPLWLAVGHSADGTATVTRCTGDGVTRRCRGTFTADRVQATGVALLGVDGTRAVAGATAPARMVSGESRQAFVGASGWTLHLRWILGVLLVLLCGLGIASATGARRLENARSRRRAVLLSTFAPVVVLVGFLAAAY
jgi:hypothetical protein